MSKINAHPYADLFPMMTEAELDALAEDIKENGLRQPIVRYGGKILDGRNRLLACERAGVDPTFVGHEGDDASALALVISLNAQRRDLTAGQKAITAARVWLLNGDGKPGRKSPETTAISLRQVARQFKVSDKTIMQARDLERDATDLADQVSIGALGLAEAHGVLMGRLNEAKKAEDRRQRLGPYAEAVSNGEMTTEEALMKLDEDKERAAHDASARQLWFKGLDGALDWIKEWVSKVSDDHLAWYTEDGAQGTERSMDADDIAEAIAQLERIKSITFNRGADNGKRTTSDSSSRSRSRRV